MFMAILEFCALVSGQIDPTRCSNIGYTVEVYDTTEKCMARAHHMRIAFGRDPYFRTDVAKAQKKPWITESIRVRAACIKAPPMPKPKPKGLGV